MPTLATSDRFQCSLGARDVERDLGGVHLERETDARFVEGVEDGVPARGEVGKARVDGCVRDRRERI